MKSDLTDIRTSLGPIKFLTKEEELALWYKMKDGDIEAKKAIVTSVLPYVFRIADKVAKRFNHSRFHDIHDVAGEMILRLERTVVPQWDANISRLTTYMTRPMFETAKLVYMGGGLIKIPRHVADIESLPHKSRALVLNLGRPMTSIHRGRHSSAQKFELSDVTSSGTTVEADYFGEEAQQLSKARIQFAISMLPDREQTIIKHRFFDGLTLRETAEAMAKGETPVTRERIRQLEKRALRRLEQLL